MPDSFGKRQRREAKSKKAAAREERRLARNQRREDRAAGILPEETYDPTSVDPSLQNLRDAEPGDLATNADGKARRDDTA